MVKKRFEGKNKINISPKIYFSCVVYSAPLFLKWLHFFRLLTIKCKFKSGSSFFNWNWMLIFRSNSLWRRKCNLIVLLNWTLILCPLDWAFVDIIKSGRGKVQFPSWNKLIRNYWMMFKCENRFFYGTVSKK